MSRRGWRRFRARRVLLNLDDGTAIRGYVLRETRSLITLAKAELVADAGDPAPSPVALDGETIIDSARVRFAQCLGEELR